eukprot:6173354-Pleurochrysis_carterae.AAC.1
MLQPQVTQQHEISSSDGATSQKLRVAADSLALTLPHVRAPPLLHVSSTRDERASRDPAGKLRAAPPKPREAGSVASGQILRI